MDKKLEKYIEDFKKNRNLKNKLEAHWLNMFLELVNFRDEYGHANVPDAYEKFRSLGYWVRRQRSCYHQNKLDPLRVTLLRSIGFNFRILATHDWNTMYDKLVQFKNKFGHVHLTERYEDRQLHDWLVYQRKLYWRGKLEKQKLEKLKTLGVDMRNKTLNRWETKFSQLVEFKKKHGHLYVCRTFTDNQQLVNFVKGIRRDKEKLSPERKKKLDELGFIWAPGKEASKMLNRKRADAIWLQHYRELKEYKEKHGHCYLPAKSKEYPTLANWASAQRYKAASLPGEKLNLLKEFGLFER